MNYNEAGQIGRLTTDDMGLRNRVMAHLQVTKVVYNSVGSFGRIASLVSESKAGIVHSRQHQILQDERLHTIVVSCKWTLAYVNCSADEFKTYLTKNTFVFMQVKI